MPAESGNGSSAISLERVAHLEDDVESLHEFVDRVYGRLGEIAERQKENTARLDAHQDAIHGVRYEIQRLREAQARGDEAVRRMLKILGEDVLAIAERVGAKR